MNRCELICYLKSLYKNRNQVLSSRIPCVRIFICYQYHQVTEENILHFSFYDIRARSVISVAEQALEDTGPGEPSCEFISSTDARRWRLR